MLNSAITLVNVGMVYAIGRRIFHRADLALVAALILALTPAHYVQAGMAGNQLYPVPFVLGWLWCMTGVKDARQAGRILAATAILGLGVSSSLVALVTMPACVVITLVVLAHQRMRTLRPYSAAAAGFALGVLPFASWLALHPGELAREVQAYALYDATRLNPLQGARELMSYVSLTERSSVYWEYFNPSFLFFSGEARLPGIGQPGVVFPWPVMALLPIGFYWIVAAPLDSSRLLLILGLLASPLAAALAAERYRIDRALVMLPFVALVATVGVEALLSAWRRIAP